MRVQSSKFKVQNWNDSVCFAFTLVELLVVLAVIGILGALLVPSFVRAKTSAQGAQCASHLRQVGLATQLYWDDHDGRAFPYRGAVTNGGTIYWFGWIQNGPEGERDFDAAAGALRPYLRGRGVEWCAALNTNRADFKLKANGATHGYGYNLALSTPPAQPGFHTARIVRPSDAVLFADAAQVNTFQPPASPEHPLLEEFYYVSTNRTEATSHFRHSGRANAVFADGHVNGERPVRGSEDRRVHGELLGRLRDDILTIP